MKIAVLSGKGGTGKTTVSASLAMSLNGAQYIDCDVEEPNGAIFLKPLLEKDSLVLVDVPKVDEIKCNGCGTCAKICQFNAIAVVKGKVLIFPEICHHCGACKISCPEKAIYEVHREIGVIQKNADDSFIQGKLNIGEPISIPILKEIKTLVKENGITIIDCPPGASCTVVESIEDCDFCILVTEPTPFGLHDLKIAVQLVRKMEIPFGIVINKASSDNNMIQQYCENENIDVLLEIPFSQKIAQEYSKGRLPVEENDKWKEQFQLLYKKIQGGLK